MRSTNADFQGQLGSSISLFGAWKVYFECCGVGQISGCFVIVQGVLVLMLAIAV